MVPRVGDRDPSFSGPPRVNCARYMDRDTFDSENVKIHIHDIWC